MNLLNLYCQPEFQIMFHNQIIPSLIGVMDDKENPRYQQSSDIRYHCIYATNVQHLRVQSHAAAAVINFCEHCQPELLEPHLDSLLGKLYTLLQSGKIMVQEQVVTAIAAVADCAESVFVKVVLLLCVTL